MKYVIIAILAIFFVYMVVWTFKLHFFTKRQKKVKRIQELRAKGKEDKKQIVDETKDYWYNRREVEGCEDDEDQGKYYHYFDSVEQCARELLLEMYDCGIVRTDELEQISYGKNRFENMDLSFLEELEREMGNGSADAMTSEFVTEVPETVDNQSEDLENGIIQVDGVMSGFFAAGKPDIIMAAKELREDDPGITDIHGTLSEGMEQVIAAVEAEKEEENKKNEPIIMKKEKSVEEARRAREMTANADVRSKVYDKWTGYVSELFSLIVIHADEEIRQKLRKALMDYGYNDVDVLLESPDYL